LRVEVQAGGAHDDHPGEKGRLIEIGRAIEFDDDLLWSKRKRRRGREKVGKKGYLEKTKHHDVNEESGG
jgi:hypothetical protein